MSSLRLKKAIAGISGGLVLLGSVVAGPLAAAAVNFSDVPTSHWGYTYVDDSVSKGFFDAPTSTSSNFYPDRNLNRAELAKLVVKVAMYAGVISGIDTTNAPTFTDVASDTWFYPYVATAAKANLLSGYKDGAGNPTGKYGPADYVTRGQAAKAFINAAGVPNKNTPSATGMFTDVMAGEWYVDYVSTAYNMSVMDGYKDAAGNMTGKFGPNDRVTRVQVAKVISNSLDPMDRTNTNTNTNGTNSNSVNGNMNNSNVNSVPKAGTLDVALSSNTPPAMIIPGNTTAAKYLTLKFTAGGSNDITISSLVITRTGLGSKDDFDKVWAEYAGNRVSNRQSVSSDDLVNLTFNPAWVIKAGTSSELDIVAQMATTGGQYNALQVQKMADVGSTAQTVTGSFPIMGNTMQSANYTVADLDFTSLGGGGTYQVGDVQVELGKFRLQEVSSSTKDTVFKRVTFKNDGSAKIDTDLVNLGLYESGVKVSNEAAVDGDYLTFDLGNGITMQDGFTKTYTILGDIIDTDVSPETVAFKVRYQEDLLAIEAQTGFGATGDWANDPLATYTLEGGTLTIARDTSSPSSQAKPILSNDVTFLVGKLNVGQAFTADGVNVYLCSNTGSTGDIEDDLDNVKLYMGNNLVETKDLIAADLGATGFTGCPASVPFAFEVLFDSTISVNADLLMTVKGDIGSAANIGDMFAFVIAGDNGSDHFLTGQSPEYTNGNSVADADIVGQALGNVVTIQDATVSISRNDGFSNGRALVPGTTNSIGKWNITANDADDLKLFEFTLDKDSTAVVLPDSYITSCDLYAGGTLVKSKNFSDPLIFNGLNVVIAKNATVSVEVKCAISAGAPGGNNFGLIPSDMDVQDSNSNGANILTTLPLASNVYLSIVSAGTLTITADSNRPLKGFLVANTTAVPLAKFKLVATNDDIKIKDLYLANVGESGLMTVIEDADARVKTYTLDWGTGTATGTVDRGMIHFALGESSTLVIAKDSNKVVTVKADFWDITLASETGKQINLTTINGGLTLPGGYTFVTGTVPNTGVRAFSNNVGADLTTAAVSGASNDFVVVKNKATFTQVAPGSTVLTGGAGQEIYRFTVASTGEIDLGDLSFDFNLSAVTLTNIFLYDVNDQSNELNLTPLAIAATGSDTMELDKDYNTNGATVNGTKTFVLKADVAIVGVGTHTVGTRLSSESGGYATPDSYDNLTGGYNILWSDMSDAAHDMSNTYDWMSGNLFNELPSTYTNYTMNN